MGNEGIIFNNLSDLGQISLQDEYQLKISSKRLKSGKCQVKFMAVVHEKKSLHGYVLVESHQTLRSVVADIRQRLDAISLARDFHHIHLYSIGKNKQVSMNFLIFEG